MNIEDVNIGQKCIGILKERYACTNAEVTDKTSNSIELMIFAKTKDGVDSLQWFTFKKFEEMFNMVTVV